MFCPNCGTQNADTAKFCANCAAPINGSQALPQNPAQYQAGPAYVGGVSGPGVSDGLKIGIAILSFFIPIVGIIMGIIFMSDADPEKKKVGKMWLIVSLVGIALGFVSCCFFGSLSGILNSFTHRL